MVEFPSFLSVSLRSATHILQLRFLLRTFMVAMWSWHAVLWLVTQSCPTLCNLMACSPLGSSVHGDSPGKNTEVGCHALLQEIFPTQGLNPGLLHCRQILYQLSCQGSPVLLVDWLFYHYEMAHLLSDKFFIVVLCSLSGVNIITPVFLWLILMWQIFSILSSILLCLKWYSAKINWGHIFEATFHIYGLSLAFYFGISLSFPLSFSLFLSLWLPVVTWNF